MQTLQICPILPQEWQFGPLFIVFTPITGRGAVHFVVVDTQSELPCIKGHIFPSRTQRDSVCCFPWTPNTNKPDGAVLSGAHFILPLRAKSLICLTSKFTSPRPASLFLLLIKPRPSQLVGILVSLLAPVCKPLVQRKGRRGSVFSPFLP